MFPPGHAAFGYLLSSLIRRAYHRDVPTDGSIPWLLLGTQLPDLVDKPLAWWFNVLQAARSLGHSLLVAGPLVVLLALWLRRRGRGPAGEALVVGFVSHLLGDAGPAVSGGLERLSFLAWPLLPPLEYSTRPSLWPPTYLLEPIISPSYDLVAVVFVGLLWIADGRPGLGYLRSLVGVFDS